MKTSTPKKRHKKSTQQQSAGPVIPKDLSDKWTAAEALSKTFKLIENGSFRYDWLETAQKSLLFLAALHEQSMSDILKHPDCKLIPQIKEHLENEAKKTTPLPDMKCVDCDCGWIASEFPNGCPQCELRKSHSSQELQAVQ